MRKLAVLLSGLFVAASMDAQSPQIPTLQVCNNASGEGVATVLLQKRIEPGKTGNMEIRYEVKCNNAAGNGFPTGALAMKLSLSDSSITDFTATTIEQMTSTGKHTPALFLNGRCMANQNTIPCHYWVMVGDNKAANLKGTADVVNVLVVDKFGKRLTYGMGPVVSGDILVAPTAN